MGINTSNSPLGSITPQCNSCGVCLCWDIDEVEYFMYKPFWDDWTCRDCNENYKGSYERYKQSHKPFDYVNLDKLKQKITSML